MDENVFEKMKKEEIRNDSIMIWYESERCNGPCFFNGGEWFWSSKKELVKVFLQNVIKNAIRDLVDGDEDNFSIDITNEKDLERVLPTNMNAKQIVSLVEDMLSDKENQSLEDIDWDMYQILEMFKQDWMFDKVYIFSTPFAARSLLEAHGKEFNKNNLQEAFEEDYSC